ncbi:MAG: UDP-N-acetylglucosamine--N-acetylmuramyl-(pentapeptide) pyrophosphoryl-undecaprenol N-acetylglucosamine transferase, partial [Gammaproteobacteria bacterium]
NTFKSSPYIKSTGNPVRNDVLNVDITKSRLQTNAGRESSLHILILGGSQGARALNEIIPDTLATLPKDVCLEVRHQAGAKLFNETKTRYQTLNVKAKVEPFIDDMGEAYGWADIVICRAGAMTISELAAAGVASILVPFPFAVDDHQTANARYLSDHGGAILFPQSQLTKEKLAELLCEFYRSRSRILEMAEKARALAKPEATQQVSELCMEAAYA